LRQRKPMVKKVIIVVLMFSAFGILSAQQNIKFFNFLDYSSKWRSGAYFNNPSGSGRWKEIFYIKGDTAINNEWYYKVYNQYQLFDNNYVIKKVTEKYVYALKEDKDSVFTFIYANGSKNTLSHASSELAKNFQYKQAFLKGQIPFVTYYDNQQFGASCGLMQGIGNTGCPPNSNGVLYFECYTKKGLSTDIIGEKCTIELLKITKTEDFDTGQIKIAPNPFNTYIQLSPLTNFYPTDLSTVSLYSANGVLQKKEILLTEKTMDTSDLPAGLYFLEVNTQKEHFFYKLIKI
jgi:Secretion system C-terminal sorting domain